MQKIKILGISIVVILVLGLYIDTAQVPPDNAMILLNHKYQTFSAPACLNPNIDYNKSEYEKSTYSFAINAMKYKEDSACTQEELFPTPSLLRVLVLEKIGILKKTKDRWNSDGTWNW